MPKITTALTTTALVCGLAVTALGCSSDDATDDGTDPTTETTAGDSTDTSADDSTETSAEG